MGVTSSINIWPCLVYGCMDSKACSIDFVLGWCKWAAIFRDENQITSSDQAEVHSIRVCVISINTSCFEEI